MNRTGVLMLLLWVSLSASAFEQVRTSEPVAGTSIVESYWTLQVDEHSKVGLHQFSKPDAQNKAAVLYLPGTNMNGQWPNLDRRHNLWQAMVEADFSVYTIDYRSHFIPPDSSEDLSYMQDWGLEAYVSDITSAFDFISSMNPDTPIFVVGFSRGVSYAYALAGNRQFAGLVALDGSFKNHTPTAYNPASDLQRLQTNNAWASVLSRTRGWDNRQEMMRNTWQAPNSEAQDMRYETIAEQLSDTLYKSWGDGALTNPVDGISDVRQLARLMEGYDRFFPAIQDVQGKLLASRKDDDSTSLDNHFGRMTLPILYFGTTNLGPDHLLNGIFSAGHSGSRDVEIHVLENHGHLDVLVGERAARDVYAVIVRWFDGHVEAP